MIAELCAAVHFQRRLCVFLTGALSRVTFILSWEAMPVFVFAVAVAAATVVGAVGAVVAFVKANGDLPEAELETENAMLD